MPDFIPPFSWGYDIWVIRCKISAMKVRISSFFVACMLLSVCADDRHIDMLAGENWWGLCSEFGRQMPFNAKSDFKCDLRLSGYRHQSMSLLVSDRGRAVWCAAPVEATIEDGSITIVSDAAPVELDEKAGTCLSEAFRHAARKWFPSSGELPVMEYFTAPQLNTWIEFTYNQNEEGILAYAKSMLDHGMPPGVFMIDDTWQTGYGTWDFDGRRFRDPKGMVSRLHEMGYKVVLWTCPFVSMDSPAFRLLDAGPYPSSPIRTTGGGLVKEANGRRVAAVDWWNGRSALVDMSSPEGRRWYIGELDRLVSEFGVDAFKFDSSGLDCYKGLRAADASLTPCDQNMLYVNLALKYRGSEIKSGFGLGGKPFLARLRDKMPTWKDLNRLVPDMIAAGMVGAPFICPDMVGGGAAWSFLSDAQIDQEYFVRSAQVCALAPMMQLSLSPWRVLDRRHQAAFSSAVALRQKFVPYIVEQVKHAAESGEPILRSLEYAFPAQGYAEIKDEFMLGDGILVAPVLEKGAKTREVVLPSGDWTADDGKTYHGPARIKIPTPLERLPYFIAGDRVPVAATRTSSCSAAALSSCRPVRRFRE